MQEAVGGGAATMREEFGSAGEAGKAAFDDAYKAAREAGKSIPAALGAGMREAAQASQDWEEQHTAAVQAATAASTEAFNAGAAEIMGTYNDIATAGTAAWQELQGGASDLAASMSTEIPDAARTAMESLRQLRQEAATEINVGGGGTGGGTNGPRPVTANVTVNLGVNENPLAAADTAAAMRQATVQWTAEAIEDRIPSIISAIEGA
jgi:hypothetical protein